MNAASEGDLIVVRDEVYVENVLIKKSVKIRSENGPERCIIESFSHGLSATVINISSKNVEVNGFTISGYNTGLSLVNVEGCKIVNNIFRGCYIGILLSRSSSNIMMNNTFLTKTGIDLEFSRRNKILHNNFTGSGLYVLDSWENDVRENLANGKTLVYLENVGNRVVEEAGQVIAIGCSRITVRGLNITNVTIGVDFYETRDSVIENNVISNGVFGISLMNSHNNRVVNNTLLNNTYGILLTDTRNVMVVNNTVRENLFGIGIGGLLESSSNEIVGNAIEDNDLGVGLTYSLNCKITKNVIRRNREGIGLLYP
ncbi:MAG: right-handed parallel beta-helix repeat-containing protein [Thermoproteota archaeon]